MGLDKRRAFRAGKQTPRQEAPAPGSERIMSKNHDNRVPVETTVTHIKGVKYAVRIFDMKAYEETIARYYPASGTEQRQHTARPGAPGRTPFNRTYPRRKGIARFNWAVPVASVPPGQEKSA